MKKQDKYILIGVVAAGAIWWWYSRQRAATVAVGQPGYSVNAFGVTASVPSNFFH